MRVINHHHQKKAGGSCQEFLRSWDHNSHEGKGPTHHASKVKCPRAKTRIDSQARRAFAPLGTRDRCQSHNIIIAALFVDNRTKTERTTKYNNHFLQRKELVGGFCSFLFVVVVLLQRDAISRIFLLVLCSKEYWQESSHFLWHQFLQ